MALILISWLPLIATSDCEQPSEGSSNASLAQHGGLDKVPLCPSQCGSPQHADPEVLCPFHVNPPVPTLKVRRAQQTPTRGWDRSEGLKRSKAGACSSSGNRFRSGVGRGRHFNRKDDLVNERGKILIFIVTIQEVLETRKKEIGSREYLKEMRNYASECTSRPVLSA